MPRRVRGIDVARGALLGLMLLTPSGGHPATYTWLRHAPWNGVTLSDLILPALLVTSGASLAFLLRPPVTGAVVLRLVRRVAVLFILGALYNAWGATYGDLSAIRLTGVLQMIGVGGGVAAVIVLLTRRSDGTDRRGALVAGALLLAGGNGVLLALLRGRCEVEHCNPLHSLDVAVFGARHTYRMGAVPYDPEGLAPMVAAAALVLVGYLAGVSVRSDGVATAARRLAVAAAALIASGLLLDVVQPVNKRLHTPAFAAVAAGVALALMALTLSLFDRKDDGNDRRGRRRFRADDAVGLAFRVLGLNALVVFVAERVLTVAAAEMTVGDRTLQTWILENLVPVATPAADLWYGIAVLALVWVIAAVMHLLRWRIAL